MVDADDVEGVIDGIQGLVLFLRAAVLAKELIRDAQLRAPVSALLCGLKRLLQQIAGVLLPALIAQSVEALDEPRHIECLRAGLRVRRAGILGRIKNAAKFVVVHETLSFLSGNIKLKLLMLIEKTIKFLMII